MSLLDEGTEPPADEEKRKKILAYSVLGIVGLVILILVIRAVASNSSGTSSGTTTTTGSSDGSTSATTTDNTAADNASNLAYQQGLAAIQNQQATLSEQLQAALLGTQTADTNQTATVQEQLSEALLGAQTTNTLALNSGNAAIQQTSTTNQINDLAYATKTLDAQQLSDAGAAFNQQQSEATTAFSNITNTLSGLLTHENGSGYSGSGHSANNLSLSDAISDFLSPANGAGSGGANASFLSNIFNLFGGQPTTAVSGNTAAQSTGNTTSTNTSSTGSSAINTFLSGLATSLGSMNTTGNI